MDKGKKSTSKFIVACSNSPKVFKFIEESFDEISFFVEVSVVTSLNLAMDSRRNDGLRANIEDVISVVTFVCNKNVNGQALEQIERLSTVVLLASSQNKT